MDIQVLTEDVALPAPDPADTNTGNTTANDNSTAVNATGINNGTNVNSNNSNTTVPIPGNATGNGMDGSSSSDSEAGWNSTVPVDPETAKFAAVMALAEQIANMTMNSTFDVGYAVEVSSFFLLSVSLSVRLLSGILIDPRWGKGQNFHWQGCRSTNYC